MREITTLQEWEGLILGVGEDRFTAEIRLVYSAQNEDPDCALIIDIPIEEVAPEEKELLKRDVIFKWIFTEKTSRDHTSRSSKIRIHNPWKD